MPVYYKITDGTHISKTPMKKLLAHVKTKAELTEYLASKTLKKGSQSGKCVVVAWSCCCEATHMDASHLASNHEEADTKLLLHAVDATISGTTSIEIMSPNTDVFVLSLRRFPQLCQNTFVLQKITLRPIGDALGPARIAALSDFHEWSGADVTGSFVGKQMTWHVKKLLLLGFELRFSLTRKGKVAMLEGIPRC